MTYNRLIKRRVLLLGLLFLLFTGAFAPIAFLAGVARGKELQADASQYGPKSAVFGDYSGQEIICGWTGKTRDPQLEAFCHPFFQARGGSGGAIALASNASANGTLVAESARGYQVAQIAPSGTSSSGGALNDAVNAYVANTSNDQFAPGNPISLALAPGGGAPSDPWGPPPTYFSGGGFPNIVVPGTIPGLPGGTPGFTPDNGFSPGGGNPGFPPGNGFPSGDVGGNDVINPLDPVVEDPIVTPLPGAIALWISGAGALFAFMRRRKKAHN